MTTKLSQLTTKNNRQMKKLVIGVAMLLFAQMSFGQAVKDNAVIPVSITLNSILRLTVTSGGNIQFVVNTIDQYTLGIANSDQYTTRFTVSSSRDFDVTMGAEDADFIGLETGLTMGLAFLQYTMGGTGGGEIGGIQELVDLTTPETIVSQTAGGQLEYEIQWELGNPAGSLADLLAANLPADIYVTNVFLNLAPQ